MPGGIRRAVVLLVLPIMGSVGLAQTPAADLHAAVAEVSYLAFDKALPLFQRAARTAQRGSPQWQQAVFGEATCLQQISPADATRLADAAALYRTLIQQCPEGKYSAQAMMALGRQAELIDYLGDQPRREEARQWYAQARSKAAGTALEHEATLRIAASYVQEMREDSVREGIAILKAWLREHPDNPLASAMWQYLGETYLFPLADHRRSLQAYLHADRIGLIEEGREGPIYWRMARLAELTGENQVAITCYTRIIERTPTSGKAYDAQLALQRLGARVPPIKLYEKRRPSGNTAETPKTEAVAP